jgi:hypothetical protein
MTTHEADEILKKLFGNQIMFTREDITEITTLTINDLSKNIKFGTGMKFRKNYGTNGKILYPITEVINYISSHKNIENDIYVNCIKNAIINRYGKKIEFRKKDIQEMTTLSIQTIDRQKKYGLLPKKNEGKNRKVIYTIDTITSWMSNYIKTT